MVWLSTTGDVLNEAQQTAFEGYIRAGGGYVGVHAAADTEYSWPWYGQLVGAYFNSHPANQTAKVDVIDRAHPSTKDLPAAWSRLDEWYNYRSSPRAQVHVLAELDESSYSPGGGAMGDDHPIAWCRNFDGGRTWYTGMGHTQESYADGAFRGHLAGGILWAAGLAAGDCSVEEPEPCEATSDEFDSATLGCQWSVVRPNASAYALTGGALKITTENGDLWGGGGTAKNLILQKAPTGAWQVTAKLQINATGGSQQGGLLLYADDDNYVKLAHIGRDGQRWFEIVQEVNGQPRYDAALDRLPVDGTYPTTMYVRLTQAEGTVTAAASTDGTNWSTVGRAANASSFSSPRVGVTAVTNDAAQVTDAHFDYFRIERSGGGEDTTPPTVAASTDGLPTSTGTYLNSATVKLDATDLGSGVETVEYALGAGAFQPYSAPVKLTSSGLLRYRATDEAGNTSPIGTANVTIAAPPACDAVAPEAGFRALYDGTIQSLSDWSMAGPGGFNPGTGCVIDAWGGMGLLWYSKQQLVSPYTIRAEWRIYGDDDNSGLFIGFPDPLDDPWKPVAQGYEIQIDPTDEEIRRTGAIYSFQGANQAAVALAIKPHGQWNVMEASVDDQLIVIRLNGVEINRYTSPHPERDPSAGFFGIQNDGAGADVSYRSVQVQGGGLVPDADADPNAHPDPDADPHTDGHPDRQPAAWYRDADPGAVAAAHGRPGVHAQLRPLRRGHAAEPEAVQLARAVAAPAQLGRHHGQRARARLGFRRQAARRQVTRARARHGAAARERDDARDAQAEPQAAPQACDGDRDGRGHRRHDEAHEAGGAPPLTGDDSARGLASLGGLAGGSSSRATVK